MTRNKIFSLIVAFAVGLALMTVMNNLISPGYAFFLGLPLFLVIVVFMVLVYLVTYKVLTRKDQS